MKKLSSIAALYFMTSVSAASAQTQIFSIPGVGNVPFQKLDSADPLMKECKSITDHHYIKGANGDLSLVMCGLQSAFRVGAAQSCEFVRTIGNLYKTFLELNVYIPILDSDLANDGLTINMRAETNFCRGIPLRRQAQP